MEKEKKEFTKAEVEVVRFEKNDVISTSTTVISVSGPTDPPGNAPGPGTDPIIP